MSPTPSIGPLLGRARELDRLTRLLEEERLVTLRSTAGVGKSRLAMEVLRSRSGTVVELDGVCDRIGFVTAVAASLDLAHAMGDPATAVRSALESRGDMLLVLDGAELLAREIAPRARVA